MRTATNDLHSSGVTLGRLGNGYNLTDELAAQHADRILAHMVALGYKHVGKYDGDDLYARGSARFCHSYGGGEPGQAFLAY